MRKREEKQHPARDPTLSLLYLVDTGERRFCSASMFICCATTESSTFIRGGGPVGVEGACGRSISAPVAASPVDSLDSDADEPRLGRRSGLSGSPPDDWLPVRLHVAKLVAWGSGKS